MAREARDPLIKVGYSEPVFVCYADIAFDTSLSVAARLLGVLWCFCGERPTYEQIHQHLGFSKAQASRYFNELITAPSMRRFLK